MVPNLVSLVFLGVVFSCSVVSGNESGYTQTKYPIVLVHGLFGFDKIMGMDYFYGISPSLTKDGATVYTARVSSLHSNERRGEQLLGQVESILAAIGEEKVNLIGHSQGALTARYVASVRPELVASVTSVGGVNKGSKVADRLKEIEINDAGKKNVAIKLATSLAKLIQLLSGDKNLPYDALASLDSLTTEGLKTFNVYYPEGVPVSDCGEGEFLADNGVYYYSWMGASTITNLLDPSDPVFAILGSIFKEPNDGLVAVCSAHLGKVIRGDYKMNHLDEINGLLGIHHLFEIDPVTVYRQHANRLKLQGL